MEHQYPRSMSNPLCRMTETYRMYPRLGRIGLIYNFQSLYNAYIVNWEVQIETSEVRYLYQYLRSSQACFLRSFFILNLILRVPLYFERERSQQIPYPLKNFYFCWPHLIHGEVLRCLFPLETNGASLQKLHPMFLRRLLCQDPHFFNVGNSFFCTLKWKTRMSSLSSTSPLNWFNNLNHGQPTITT